MNWWWHDSLVVLHVQEDEVDCLDVAQSLFTISNGEPVVLGLFASLGPLQVQQRAWGFGIAEGNLSQATLNNQRPGFRPRLGSLDGSLNLLLHTLHMVIATPGVPTRPKSIVGLEQVGLGKRVGGLLRMLTGRTSNLTEDVVVKVFCNGGFGALFIQVSRRRHQLLQLDTGNEVLVLGGHEAVVFREKGNLVVALGSPCVFLEKGSAL